VIVDVVAEERYWYPADGGIVWVAGYQLVDRDTGRYLGRDDPAVLALGVRTASVAGAARHHAEVLQSDAVAPGRPLVLRRDAGNPHDPNAVAVETAGGAMVGFVPRELAVEVAPELDAGRPWTAVVLRERRDSPREARTGITMLLAPDSEVSLRPRPGSAPV
jgi:hypothetical protein